MSPKIVTANRLCDGAVVYLAADGAWVTRIAGALAVDDERTQQALMDAAARDVAARLVVGPYLMAVARDGVVPVPLSQRERIRAAGPSVAIAAKEV